MAQPSQFGQYFNPQLAQGVTDGISLESLNLNTPPTTNAQSYFAQPGTPSYFANQANLGTPMDTQQPANYYNADTVASGVNTTPGVTTTPTIDPKTGLPSVVPGTDLAGKQIGLNNYYQAQADKINAGPGMGEYISMGADGLGAVVGLANYFDTKSINKVKKQALNQNMAHAAQGRQDKTNFISGTSSAFA